MAIGSKVIGKAVVAGQYGIIQAETGLVGLSQTVQLVDPAKTLVTVEQSVEQIDRARLLVSFTQRVVADSVDAIFVPLAYVELNGVILTCSTAYNNVRVTHNEDQSSTATMNVTYPTGMVINIPSFHGKPVRILVHEDENDITSELIPLFTGWVESAKHDLKTQSIDFTCSDLRDERLGREDGQALKQLTGGLYSNVTQREDVSGREYVTELMKTVSGSLGYTRSGDLRYHSWGVTGKPVDLTLGDADVAYNDLTTEFQTRSEVRNVVNIEIDYRYYALRKVTTSVSANKGIRAGWDTGWSWFSRDTLKSRCESGFSPWYATAYAVSGAPYVGFYHNVFCRGGASVASQLACGLSVRSWSRSDASGLSADLTRNIAQPIKESHKITIKCPQSIGAYGEEIEGSPLKYGIDFDFEESKWEDPKPVYSSEQALERNEFGVDLPSLRSPAPSIRIKYEGGGQLKGFAEEVAGITTRNGVLCVDDERAELGKAINAAYAIAKKELIGSHRKNYVSSVVHRIQPLNIGDVAQHNNRIIQTTGQIVGLQYTIADGVRDTQIRIAVSYMDTDTSAPTAPFSPNVDPLPPVPAGDIELESDSYYDSEKDSIETNIAEVPESITDEIEQVVSYIYEQPLEVNNIILVNGY